MPVRIIPKNFRNVTGRASSNKTESAFFESTLERDFLAALDFDTNVVSYDVQPLTINWFDTEGNLRKYTPDVLVSALNPKTGKVEKILYEVKYREEIKKKWKKLKPKFKAALRYASAQGWKFKIVSEQEVKTAYTDNARFLLPYVNQQLNEDYENLILDELDKLEETSIEELLNRLSSDPWLKADYLPTVWHLIGVQRIGADLYLPLTMTSNIWDVGE